MSAVPAARRAEPRLGLVLSGLLLASAGPSLSQTLVVPALAEIEREYATSPESAAWVLTGFLLSVAVSTPLAGKLGDLYGKRPVVIGVIASFAAGSVACAVAGSIGVLIAGRVLQGVCGGIFPLAFAVIRDLFPPARVPTAIGAVSATFGIGAALGLALSGVIVEGAGIEWLFWIGLAIVPAGALLGFALPAPRRRHGTRVDWAGAVLLSASLIAVLLGITNSADWGWGSVRTLAAIGGGIAIGALWVAHEARRVEPLVEVAILRHRPVLLTNLCGLAIGFVMFAAFLLVPQVAQAPERAGYGLGASVSEAGLLMAPGALAMIVAGPLAGVLATRRGSRVPLWMGALASALALGLLTVAHDAVAPVLVAVVLVGAGIGLVFAAMANLVVESVPAGAVGVATGINTITRTVGGAIGAQVATAIVAATTLAGGLPPESGYTAAFAAAAAIAVGALVAALGIPRRRPGREPAAAVAAP